MVYHIAIEYIFKKSLKQTLVVLIQGSTQTGKSTVLKTVADILSLMKKEEYWKHEKYCARNFDELINYVDDYENSIIAIEEAGFQLSSDEWQNVQNKLFNKILQTQAYKHNIIFIVLPYALGVAKAHRRIIDMGLTIKKRYDKPPMTLVYPVVYQRVFWKLDETSDYPLFLPMMLIKYNKQQMKRAKNFTDKFLVDYKKSIMEQIKAKWNRKKPDRKQPCFKCGSLHEAGNCELGFLWK